MCRTWRPPRLTDSAVVLAAGEGGPDLQMQRLLRRAGRPCCRRRCWRSTRATADAGPCTAGDVEEEAGRLLDLARLQEGDLPRDPAAFARQIDGAIAGG